MKSEYKLQLTQFKADTLANGTLPLTSSDRAQLWPESQHGGDGPWNNYGEEDRGEPYPIVIPTAKPDDVPSHDFF